MINILLYPCVILTYPCICIINICYVYPYYYPVNCPVLSLFYPYNAPSPPRVEGGALTVWATAGSLPWRELGATNIYPYESMYIHYQVSFLLQLQQRLHQWRDLLAK